MTFDKMNVPNSDKDLHLRAIFYGAGKYALDCIHERNGGRLYGVKIDCFADADTSKQHTRIAGYEILPLDEAIKRYPDYEIYVTGGGKRHNQAVTEYLVEKSIPREKIRFPNGVELDGKPKYCEIMTRYIRLDDGSAENNLLEWGFCCFQNGNRFKCSGDGLDNAYLEFVAARDRMIADLQAGYDCPCTGCPMLKTGTPPPRFGKPDIFFVLGTGLVGANSCNFKCGYCIFKNYIHQPGNQCINYSVIDVLEWLVKQSHFNVEFLGYECGELTVSVLRHQVYDIWKEQKWRGRILTNAGIFSQEIAELFSKEQVGAIISLDAGTRETFAKIKGVDCFDRVLENLKLYAGALKDGERRLNLKYILLDDVNDNGADVTEFIRICAELNARPILTIDYWIGENPFGIWQIEMFKRFKDEADKYGLTCYFRDNSLNIGNMSVVSDIFGEDKLLYEEQNCDALND